MDDKLLKLRNYLKDRGFTQVKIAELFNVDKGYINQLLTGRKAFGKRTAQEWSDQFGLSASWLLTGEGEMTKESTKTDDSSSPCFDITTIQGGAGHGTGMEQITASMADQAVGRMMAPGLPDELVSARDLFLWQCYTGMAWVDCATLTSDMVSTENGHIYIIRSRQKTGVQYRTMLLKPAAAILAKYGGTLPKLVSYTYHHRLQRIAKAAGITKHVTSHVGRHTFATWALSHGVPIEIVSKMLGHTNIETTQIYAKILAKDVDAQFERLDGLF